VSIITPMLSKSRSNGADIARRRRALGMTQHQLANAARCSRAYIALIEAGGGPARSRVLPDVERVLSFLENRRGLVATPSPDADSREESTRCVAAT
jgi:predicted transcriptional regulator